MMLYPAIDLKDGKCVRLYKGDEAHATIYNENPVDQAKQFEALGFKYLHVVDLDAAIHGRLQNQDIIADIASSLSIPMQFGGGIRNREVAEMWLERGVTRIILGTVALKNPDLVKELAHAHPHKIMVGIDARDGMVAVEGWTHNSSMRAVDLARQFEDAGVAGIIYTDISRDGTMQGPNAEETAALGKAVSIPVILSGGIGSLADIEHVKKCYAGAIEGIILGRALYEQTIDVPAALALTAA